jgi:hypothetical protein
MLPRFLKFLHQIGAVGVSGSLGACIVLVATAPTHSLIGYAAVRQGIAAVTQWLLVPSLALVLVSGLLALAVTQAYHSAGWAWVKALLGIGMFEGTLLTIDASARKAAALSALAASGGGGDPTLLAQVVRTERGGLWLLLALSLANIALAVWRPRFGRSAIAATAS